jgi:AbiTii
MVEPIGSPAVGQSLSEHRLALARELLDDLELGRLTPEALLLKASRLARLTDATETQEWLRLELRGYLDGAWGSVHEKYKVLTGRLTDPKTGFGYWQPFAGLNAWVGALEAELRAIRVPEVNFAPSSANPQEYVVGFIGQHVATAMAPVNAALNRMKELTTDIASMRGVISKVLAVLHEFASTTYYQLAFGSMAEGIFEAHRRQIDALLAKVTGRSLEKMPAVSERLAAGDPEAISQALTTCRRVLADFADTVQPPTDDPILLGGKQAEAGKPQYLNRLRHFIEQRCSSDGRRKRLIQTVTFLNERFNAATHAEVTPNEARALFVILYVTLGEILAFESEAMAA